MSTLLTIVHVMVCLLLMLTVLLQQGKGGGMGGAFGGGNAATVFGGSGASTFLRKLTATAAGVFMATSMILAFIASHNSADALEKFGASQGELAKQKADAKAKAVKDAAGSASGSANGSNAPSGPAMMMVPAGSGSAQTAPATGSGGLDLPTAPTSAAGTPGVAPAEAPTASANGSSAGASAAPAMPPSATNKPTASPGKPSTTDDGKTPDQRLRDSVK